MFFCALKSAQKYAQNAPTAMYHSLNFPGCTPNPSATRGDENRKEKARKGRGRDDRQWERKETEKRERIGRKLNQPLFK